jgi:divalent metal cation (Fe/Co/Zn/Cd) transporter
MMLLDAALPAEDVAKITAILDKESDIDSYHDLLTRHSGSDIYISVHTVYSISTSLYDAHLVGDRIELAFKKCFPDNTVHPLIHLDPYDDSGTED